MSKLNFFEKSNKERREKSNEKKRLRCVIRNAWARDNGKNVQNSADQTGGTIKPFLGDDVFETGFAMNNPGTTETTISSKERSGSIIQYMGITSDKSGVATQRILDFARHKTMLLKQKKTDATPFVTPRTVVCDMDYTLWNSIARAYGGAMARLLGKEDPQNYQEYVQLLWVFAEAIRQAFLRKESLHNQ